KPAVLFLGPELVGQAGELTIAESASSQPATLQAANGSDDPLRRDVNWNSAPQVRERSSVQGPGIRPLVNTEDGELIVGRWGQVLIVTPWLTGEHNTDLQEWPYFNYLVYHLAESAAGRLALAYANYPVAPVPQSREKTA